MCSRKTLHTGALVLLLSGARLAPGAAQTATSAAWQATPASVLKNTLRAATAAQARYYQSQKTYAPSVQALGLEPDPDVQVRILAAGPDGWQARAVHAQQPGRSCVIFVGRVQGMQSPTTDGDREMAGEEGVPLCDTMR